MLKKQKFTLKKKTIWPHSEQFECQNNDCNRLKAIFSKGILMSINE